MPRSASLLAAAALLLAGNAFAIAQDRPAPDRSAPERPAVNPLNGNPDAIRDGQGLYRVRCAQCHGMDARGVRGPDLTMLWAAGRTDGGIYDTLRRGVPGTEMPAIGPRTREDDVWKIVAYLRTLAVAQPAEAPRGNAENGRRIFEARCSTCHRVNGQGGRLGPDLSRVGSGRTRQTMTRQIRGAVEGFMSGYEPVTLTTENGRAIRGVKKNEDLFSVQIMDTGERIQGYLKDDLRQVADGTRSAMPAFGPDVLNENDLTDLLRYLETLRGPDTAK